MRKSFMNKMDELIDKDVLLASPSLMKCSYTRLYDRLIKTVLKQVREEIKTVYTITDFQGTILLDKMELLKRLK